MHCCDIIRAGQILPSRLPDDWLPNSGAPRERTGSLATALVPHGFAGINQELKDVFKLTNTNENISPETVENERKNSVTTYEEKRQKNYEVCIDFDLELKRKMNVWTFRMDLKN